MRRIIQLLFIQMVCATAGFTQSSPWKANNEAVPPRPDLHVIWKAPTTFPRNIWVYRLLPNNFPPEIISNLMTLCAFTGKDKIRGDTNTMTFQSADRSRSLSVSYSSGDIDYQTAEIRYSPTNLAVDVPSTKELPAISESVLKQLGIKFTNITGWIGTNKIDFSEPLTTFYVGSAVITNIPYRTVYFRRCVDGMPIAYDFYRFNVGEHGRLSKISISWPDLKRVKSLPAVSSTEVMDFIRRGDATHGPVTTDVGEIDWLKIKSLTITDAIPSYLVNGKQLYPFLYLGALVDTGSVKCKIGMACPLVNETKL